MCLSRPRPAAPPPPPPPPKPPAASPKPSAASPKPSDPATKAARVKEKKKLATQRGRKSTILTGPRGDLSAADTRQKTLLGA